MLTLEINDKDNLELIQKTENKELCVGYCYRTGYDVGNYPNQFSLGCEGSYCEETYENYLEDIAKYPEEDDISVIITEVNENGKRNAN